MFGSSPNLLESSGEEKEHHGRKNRKNRVMKHHKEMSLEEGRILDSLNEMYKEIDPNKPDELLTSEQVVIKKLKKLYEDDSLAYRPVAPRAKVDLAISKPLLQSVYSNPKLEEIAKNSDLKNLETEGATAVSNNEDELPELKRYSSKEDLTEIGTDESFDVRSVKRSSLKSNTSGSSSRKRVSFDEEKNSCLVIKEFLSMESLEDIYKSIDHNLPEERLTKDQRFALRLKASIENLGEKPELRKRPTFKKHKVTIGLPTEESVMKNTKLCRIIKDPIVMQVGDTEGGEMVELRKLDRMKKHLGDINRVLRHSKGGNKARLPRKYSSLSGSLQNIDTRTYTKFKRISSSMENLPSDNSRFGEPEIQIEVVTKVLPVETHASPISVSSGSSSVGNSSENLVVDTRSGVEIQDVSNEFQTRNSQLFEGRISFPESETQEQTFMRLLSINSVEMEDEDEVLARYKRFSLDNCSLGKDSDWDESQDVKPGEIKSLDSITLSNAEEISLNSNNSAAAPESLTVETELIETNSDEEEREKKKVKDVYKEVVQEIKRKYSCDEIIDTSDEEAVHIFNPKECKIEVRRFSEDTPTKPKNTFFDEFYRKYSLDENFNRSPEVGDEMEFIRRVRKEHEEEFEEIDKLGYVCVPEERRRNKLSRQGNVNIDTNMDDLESRRESTRTFLEKEVDFNNDLKSNLTIDDLAFIDAMRSKYLGQNEFCMDTDKIDRNSLSSNSIKVIKYNDMSQSELELLSSSTERTSGPLSDINVEDIAFIDSMKLQYLDDNENHDGNETTSTYQFKNELTFRNSSFNEWTKSFEESLKSNRPFELRYTPVFTHSEEIVMDSKKSVRKPKPLPRKLNQIVATEKYSRNESPISSVAFDYSETVNCVKIEHGKDEEFLPNSSKVMNASRMVEVAKKSGKIDDRPLDSLSGEVSEESQGMNTSVSTNVTVRKTKKFVKEGEQFEEFDETLAACSSGSVPREEVFDSGMQLIPDSLVDYVDSESKVALFDNGSRDTSEFSESCSRPQTSSRGSTTFRLSYYGENSDDSVEAQAEISPKRSKERVSILKQKFENLPDESKTNSTLAKEFKDTQRAQLAKLLSDKAAYDLVFKTDSKYWFDNNPEADKSDAVIHHAAPSFESSASGKPLNITILDPVESETNANYQHLFENDPLNGVLQKTFIGTTQLSELNLKTSIPCVDFTTLSPMVEKGSNASLYNFGLAKEGQSRDENPGGCSKKRDEK